MPPSEHPAASAPAWSAAAGQNKRQHKLPTCFLGGMAGSSSFPARKPGRGTLLLQDSAAQNQARRQASARQPQGCCSCSTSTAAYIHTPMAICLLETRGAGREQRGRKTWTWISLPIQHLCVDSWACDLLGCMCGYGDVPQVGQCLVAVLLLLQRQVKVCQPGNCQLECCRAQGVDCHVRCPFSFLQE